jgi:hypothetical protein
MENFAEVKKGIIEQLITKGAHENRILEINETTSSLELIRAINGELSFYIEKCIKIPSGIYSANYFTGEVIRLYVNETEDGDYVTLCQKLYDGLHPKEVYEMKNFLLDGCHTTYDSNFDPKSQTSYKEGKRHGNHMEFGPNFDIICHEIYDNGELVEKVI